MPKVKIMRKKDEAERERERERHYYVLLIQEICFSHATQIGEY